MTHGIRTVPIEPTPVAEDLHATPAQLLARAAEDRAAGQAATQKREAQGGTGHREGVLSGADL